MKRHKRTFLLAFLVALVVMLAIGLYYAWSLAQIGAALKAKTLCSGFFVSQRSPESILNTDLAGDDLSALRYFDAQVDRASQMASASFLGVVSRKAIYRPGLGCTLIYNDSEVTPSVPIEKESQQAHLMSGQWVGEMPGQTTLEHVDKSRLNSALEWAFSEPDPQHLRRTRAVVIVQNDRIIAERYAEGFDRDTPLIGWSMTKSVTNALVGILVRTGRLSLDEPVPLPEWQKPGDSRKKITLNHLLHMSSGLEFGEESYGPWDDVTYMLLRVSDMAAFAAKKKLAAEPGTKWYYSSGNTNIICRIIRRVVGEADYISFPRRELFEPIGMFSAVIELDASGTFAGSSFMYATARDWARFGQLYLHDGIWAGRRILPEGWVKYTTTPAPESANKDYGAHFWLKIPKNYRSNRGKDALPHDIFHAVGHEGQFLTIIPSRSLVVVRLGLSRLPHVWQHDEFINMILEALKG